MRSQLLTYPTLKHGRLLLSKKRSFWLSFQKMEAMPIFMIPTSIATGPFSPSRISRHFIENMGRS
jgi:hypothetical protein